MRRHGTHIADKRPKRHLPKNVPLQIDARGHLQQLEAGLDHAENGAFGHNQDFLPSPQRTACIERDLLDAANELLLRPFLNYANTALPNLDL